MRSKSPDTDIPRIFRVILPVNDIEKAHKFYSKLLNMEGKRVSTGRHYFQCGGTILACFDPKKDGDDFELPPNPDNIYFSVNNLNVVFKRAQALEAMILDGIDTRPWGETSFYLKDPFGNKICFVQEETVFRGIES